MCLTIPRPIRKLVQRALKGRRYRIKSNELGVWVRLDGVGGWYPMFDFTGDWGMDYYHLNERLPHIVAGLSTDLAPDAKALG